MGMCRKPEAVQGCWMGWEDLRDPRVVFGARGLSREMRPCRLELGVQRELGTHGGSC